MEVNESEIYSLKSALFQENHIIFPDNSTLSNSDVCLDLEIIIKQAKKFYSNEEIMKCLEYLQSIEKRNLFYQIGSNSNILHLEERMISSFYQILNENKKFSKINSKAYDLSYFVNEDKTMTIKLTRTLHDVKLINFLSLLYESDYYNKWIPFCNKSECPHQPEKAKKVVYLVTHVPFIKERDFLVYGFGVNRLKDNRSIVLLLKSIENEVIFEDIVKKYENNNKVRALINNFGFEIQYINEKEIKIKGIVNINPMISYVPQFIINSIMKTGSKYLFNKIMKLSQNYEGSDLQNKNPSELDKIFYNFVENEIKDL